MTHAISYIRRDQYTGKVLEFHTYTMNSKREAIANVKAHAKAWNIEYCPTLLKAESFIGLGGIEVRYEVNGEQYSPEPIQD